MRKSLKKAEVKNGNTLVADAMVVVKSSIAGVIITLIFFIIFSIIMKIGNLDDRVIPPTSQAIRVVSIALGGAIAARSSSSKGWLKGAITGIIYILWAYIISALFGNKITLSKVAISDIGMSTIVGAIGGIIGINLD